MIKLILEYLQERHERKMEAIRAENHCLNCDRLMSIIEQDRGLIAELSKGKEVEPEPEQIVQHRPIGRSAIPWHVRKAKLERDFRKQKMEMERNNETIVDKSVEANLQVEREGSGDKRLG